MDHAVLICSQVYSNLEEGGAAANLNSKQKHHLDSRKHIVSPSSSSRERRHSASQILVNHYISTDPPETMKRTKEGMKS